MSICLINGFLYVTLQIGGGCSRWVLRCEGIMRILSCRGLNARRCCHGKRDRVKLVKPLRARTREAAKNRQRTIQRHLGFTVLELGRSARSNIPKINDSHARTQRGDTFERSVGGSFFYPYSFTRFYTQIPCMFSCVLRRARRDARQQCKTCASLTHKCHSPPVIPNTRHNFIRLSLRFTLCV